MEKQQLQNQPIDTRVNTATKKKKREFKNRKTFSLKSMEELVDRVAFLKTKYDTLAVNAQEKLGYHYNEILNILLFHKYVKPNKKLFDMYKKIKDAVNKGYEFDKKKKVQENTMGKIIKESKNTHFAINKNTNKILESWNYEGYDHDELKAYKDEYFTKDIKTKYPFLNENDVTVVTRQNLSKRNLNESLKKNWEKYNFTHVALLKETNHILHGFNYSDISQEELNNNKKQFFLEEISRVYGSEIEPKDIKIVKVEKLNNLGINDSLNESNWVGLINEAYCGSKMDEMIDEEMDDNIYEYEVPSWALSALINGDVSGLSDEDEQKLDKFIDEVVSEVGNANFYGGSEEDSLGFRRSNDIDNLGSEVYKVYVRKDSLEESSDVGSVFGAEGMPVANPYMRPKKGFDLSPKQDMFKAKNMLPSVKKGIKKYQSEFSNPTFKQTTEPEFITPVKTTHFQGTRKKAMKENYELVDLNALMNDDIQYIKLETNKNNFKSSKLDLIRENNRESIIEFLLKNQGTELPEFYNKRQFNTLSLKTLNEYYNRLVQRLDLVNEEAKPKALVDIERLKNQTQKDSNNYYKKDASNKTTTMLVQKGEGDGLTYDKDSRQRKDIPKYKYQSEAQREYLEKIHRGLEDVQPENGPNGEVDAQWLARKEALMSTQEVGAKAFKDSQKRIEFKNKNKLGTNKAALLQRDLPKVKQSDKVLKENSNFNLVKENNILDQIQSFYVDEDNRKKPVIFDANDVIEMVNENKLVGCKELTYKGLGQTLSENFNAKVLNKKLLYSTDSKKVYLV
jgi:hypothetical protein